MGKVRSIFDPPEVEDPDNHQTLFQAWKAAPSPTTMTALLNGVKPVLQTAVRSYGGGGVSPNLANRAKLLAAKSFNTYDPAKGTLKTHLLSQLRGLRRFAGQEQNVIRLPEQVALDRQHLLDATNTLRDELGREPNDSDLSDYTGLSMKRLGYIRSARLPVNPSTFQVDAEGEPMMPPSVIPGATDSETAWIDFIYDDLDPTNKFILDATLGRNGNKLLTTDRLAAKLGLTPAAISQRKAKIQKMIDSRYDAGLF